jgi:hypothetical protein
MHALAKACEREDDMGKPVKVPVTMRALLARINRKLAKECEQLVKARGEAAAERVGEYYIIHVASIGERVGRNSVAETFQNPEKLGRRLGVLNDWEEVQE